MWGGAWNRLIFVGSVIRAHPVVKYMLGLWLAICTYDTFLSQLIPEQLGNRLPKVRDLIEVTGGYLPLWAWLLILATILLIASLEYTFQLSRVLAARKQQMALNAADQDAHAGVPGEHTSILRYINGLRRQVGDAAFGAIWPHSEKVAATTTKAAAMEIIFRPGVPYEASEIICGRTKSTVSIGIKNSGGVSLTDCKIYVEQVTPPPGNIHREEIPLEGSGFMLRPFEPEHLTDVAMFWQHIGKYRFLEPISNVSAVPFSYIDKAPARRIVIRAAATECAQSAMFEIWVDADEILRMKKVSDVV